MVGFYRWVLPLLILLVGSSARAASAEDEHRRLHRIFTYVGFAPALVTLLEPTGDGENENAWRFRQRAVTLGAAYRHHFYHSLGLHAGVGAGVGRSQIGLGQDSNFTDCCSFESKQVAPSFSLDFEVSALVGPFGPVFYIAPGLMTRLFFPLERSATFNDDLEETITAHFPSPLGAGGARFSLGVMLGAHHEYDLGAGLDLGYAFGSAEGYMGLFVRFGVAFGDLSSGRR